ncbi:MAG: helix-turn-helix transcriptional regulator [Desulfosarcina sp.]|nr:helix-turn-helix transcriptional regulator [Desulfosarcina sp.]MBC2742209.1 helix-turn-helix transcriptional regulator [Desulfosarcina sp.]MBC2765121.1 helix-turn-helix transcriptional regulator [Desulfosarcina sp.]
MAVKIGAESVSSVGRIIRFHRKIAGLSRIELADIAGVGKTVVYDIEKGKETVRLDTLLKLLGALNVTVSLAGPMMERYEAGDDAES